MTPLRNVNSILLCIRVLSPGLPVNFHSFSLRNKTAILFSAGLDVKKEAKEFEVKLNPFGQQ